MKEMEYGSGENKSKSDGVVSVARIYPSHLVNTVRVDDKGTDKEKTKSAEPKEQRTKDVNGIHDDSELSDQEGDGADVASKTSDVTEVVTGDEQATHTKDVSTAISLLRSFVKKLLAKNGTKEVEASNATSESGTSTISLFNKQDKNTSKTDDGTHYNLAPVFKIKSEEEKHDRLKTLMEEEENLRHTLEAKQHEIKKLKEENNNGPANETKSTAESSTNEIMSVAQNQTNDEHLKISAFNGLSPDFILKLKELLDAQKKKKENEITKEQTSSMKAFETAKKLVKAALAREEFHKAEDVFYKKVKEMTQRNQTSDILNNTKKSDGNEDLSNVNDYIKTLEAEQKNLAPMERRTQPSVNTSDNAPSLNSSSPLNTTTPKAQLNSTDNPQTKPVMTHYNQNVINSLNHTKSPDEKSVEAAAHLEEKVAEQQNEMYEDLIRHSMNKGHSYNLDEEDEEEDDAEARDTYGQPPENNQQRPMQENYGDFQDSDEQEHLVRSKVSDPKLPKVDQKVRYIDEDAIYSLKKDKISRPRRMAKRKHHKKHGKKSHKIKKDVR